MHQTIKAACVRKGMELTTCHGCNSVHATDREYSYSSLCSVAASHSRHEPVSVRCWHVRCPLACWTVIPVDRLTALSAHAVSFIINLRYCTAYWWGFTACLCACGHPGAFVEVYSRYTVWEPTGHARGASGPAVAAVCSKADYLSDIIIFRSWLAV